MGDANRTAAFIRENLPVVPVPGIPEIRLHKAAPSSGLRRLGGVRSAPYWAYHWAGGLALARHILDNPAMVAGRTVLDLGSGSGLVAIAAMQAGARRALAAEVDAHAVVAIGLNAALNETPVSVLHGDVTDDTPPDVDIVLAGDLFYERAVADRVTAFLDQCLERGIRAFIGDPWRTCLPLSRLRLLARYEVAEAGLSSVRDSGVFAFLPDGRPA